MGLKPDTRGQQGKGWSSGHSRENSDGLFDSEVKSNFFKPSKFSAYKSRENTPKHSRKNTPRFDLSNINVAELSPDEDEQLMNKKNNPRSAFFQKQESNRSQSSFSGRGTP